MTAGSLATPTSSIAASRRAAPWGSEPIAPRTLLLAGLILANLGVAVLWPHPIGTLFALVLMLLAIGRMFSIHPVALVFLAPFIILNLSVMVSLIAIESGTLMKEMGVTGHASPAGASYVIYCLIFLLAATQTFRRLQLRLQTKHPEKAASATAESALLDYAALCIGGLAALYLIAAGLRTGFPLITGTDRFQFRANTADIVTLNLLNLKFTIGAMLGVGAAWSTSRWRTSLHHLVFAAYIVVSFLYGDKFFIVLIASCFYAMPFLVRDPRRVAGVVRQSAPWVIIMLLGVCSVTLFIYSGYGRLSLEDTLTKLATRVAGQGQLWFLAVEDAPRWIGFDTEIVSQNLGSVFANPAATYVFEHRLAAFHFVEKYSPSAMYVSFLHNGGTVTPTMVFEAYGLVAFGFVGLAVLMLLMGVIVGMLLHWLARALLSGNPINALLPAFVLSQSIAFMSQATVYSLVSLSIFKSYAAFLVLQLIVSAWLRYSTPPEPFARLEPMRKAAAR